MIFEPMESFLKTKKGLEYLLETFSSDIAVTEAIQKAEDDYCRSQIEEQEAGYL